MVGLMLVATFMTNKDSNKKRKKDIYVVYTYVTEFQNLLGVFPGHFGKKMCVSLSWSFQTNRKSK